MRHNSPAADWRCFSVDRNKQSGWCGQISSGYLDLTRSVGNLSTSALSYYCLCLRLMPVNPAVVTLTEWFVLDKRLLSHIKRTVDNQKNVFISNVVMGYRHMSDKTNHQRPEVLYVHIRGWKVWARFTLWLPFIWGAEKMSLKGFKLNNHKRVKMSQNQLQNLITSASSCTSV